MNRCQRLLAAGTLLAGVMFLSQRVAAPVFRIAEMNTRRSYPTRMATLRAVYMDLSHERFTRKPLRGIGFIHS